MQNPTVFQTQNMWLTFLIGLVRRLDKVLLLRNEGSRVASLWVWDLGCHPRQLIKQRSLKAEEEKTRSGRFHQTKFLGHCDILC